MYLQTLFVVIAAAPAFLALLCCAVPVDHVVHEEREIESTQWQKRGQVEPHAVLPVRIGLTQSNLENAYDYLMDVSDPDSSNYGRHWTQEEVIAKFAPPKDTVKAVYTWLEASGIQSYRVIHHDNRGWLVFNARAHEMESLVHTKFHEYEHTNGLVSVGCDRYHVPAHIQPHIDYITPGIKLSAPLKKRQVAAEPSGRRRRGNFELIAEEPNVHPEDLTNCDTRTTPACVRALYQIPLPKYRKAHPNNTYAVFERGDSFYNGDQDLFFSRYAPHIPNGTHPISVSIDGGVEPSGQPDNANPEGELDIQVAYPILYPQKIIWYSVDDPYWARRSDYFGVGDFNTFLDALDGSYCNYTAFGETGDDPIDPIYPDKTHKNGYKGPGMCGVFKPAKVISISYGLQEDTLPDYYQRRQCNEWLKLGLQGTSVVRASGDEGVGGAVVSKNKTLCRGAHHKRFAISGPDGCPALLTVGGTQIPKGNTIHNPEHAMFKPRFEFFYSTGGFSNVFRRPKYQDQAVQSYFKNHKPPYRSYAHIGSKGLDKVRGRYNRIGRGIPDVAALGSNFVGYAHGGRPARVSGTSASSPLFAALLARINDERLRRGKSTVGFVNPVLYKHPEVFNDIIYGTNPGCGTEGFRAVKGWDPVTGLGTPNYPRMLKLFLSLP